MTLANLSFEDLGAAPGDAAGWTWTRATAFVFAGFAAATGISRFESFEFGWHMPSTDLTVQNYPPVGPLVVPSTALALVFGSLGAAPSSTEGFERQWRMPGVDDADDPAFDGEGSHPPDATHPGNETAFFVWEATVAAVFGSARAAVENFESGWSADESYAWVFALGAALGVEGFETGWKSNDTYRFAIGSLAAGTFVTVAGSSAFDDFSAVQADQPVTFLTSSNIIKNAAHLFVGQQVTFYNAGDGELPPELNPRIVYRVTFSVVVSGIPEIAVGLTTTGAPIVLSTSGSGSNFIKADRTLFWTLTDVGI